MAANKNALVRYKILDELLSDPHHFYTREMLKDKVNERLRYDSLGYNCENADSPTVSKRTIEKDLNNMAQIWDLEYDEPERSLEGKGYKKIIRYPDSTFSIFKKQLSNDEKKLLYEVLNTLGQFSGMDNFEWLADLKTKLEDQRAFGESMTSTGEAAHRKILWFSENKDLKNKESLAWFFKAISNKKVISVTYRKFGAEPNTFIVHPYMLKQYNDRWYLLATPDLDKEKEYDPEMIINIPLDRIESYEYYEGISYKECPVDIEERYEEIVGMTYKPQSPVEDVVFAIRKGSAHYVRTKPIHPYQKEYPMAKQQEMREKHPELDDFSFFHMKLRQNYELESVLRSFGNNLVVLQPDSLRDKMRESANILSELYSAGGDD